MEKQLPKNWVEVSLKEVTNNRKGKKPNVQSEVEFEGSIPYMDIKALEHNIIRQYADIESSKLFEEGDIAMVWDGARSGWVSKTNMGAIGSTLVAFKPILFNSNYLYYYLLDKYPFINSNARGVGIPHVDPTVLWNLKFPLSPLVEQNRIVGKLDNMFNQLETIKSSMANIPLLLKDFRHQVLMQAVTGKLTEKWRNGRNLEDINSFKKKIDDYKHSIYESDLKKWKEKSLNKKSNEKIIKPSKPKNIPKVEDWENENNVKIPNDWLFVRFNDVTNKIGDIDHKMPKICPEGIPYLSTGNMKDINNLDFENAKKISIVDYEVLSAKIKPERGDIIFPRYGTIGRNILIDFDKIFLVSYSCAIIKNFKELMSSKYIYFVSISQFTKFEISKHVVQTTQANIGIASIEKFLFPLCTLEEQNEIVKRVESLFAKADAIEQQYKSLKEKIDNLPQALLHKAFKGELTEQLDTDGDAKELLKAIADLKNIKVSKPKAYKVPKEKLRLVAEPK
jgi:type I restriction enzyme S subunit